MKAKLILNGYDAGPWLKRDGLTQTEVKRLSRTVITMDGTKHQVEITKRRLNANFRQMRDKNWYALKKAIKSRPVEVQYLDDDDGERTAYFLVNSAQATAEVVAGGVTWFDGCSISLEER